jgi:intergrase/recombinase
MLSARNKHHAMTALANLSKFQGRYDQWLQIRQRYNMKWSKTDSIQSFERFFDDELNFDFMLQRIREMIQKLPTWAGNVVKFGCLVGLRSSEIVESAKLINGDNETFTKYYNPDRQALEHYKFPKQFVRTTKACYISIVSPHILELIKNLEKIPKSYNDFRVACYTKGIKCDLRFARKIFASWLHKCGLSSVIIDLLQGRVPKSVLVQHYLVPVGVDYKHKVLQAVSELRRKIEET